MSSTDNDRFDVASYQGVGARSYQEDALAAEFSAGADFGIVVLSDGMGGHAAGEVASAIVIEESLDELVTKSEDIVSFSHNIFEILKGVPDRANLAVLAHTQQNPDARGMGATLVAAVVLHNLLYWVSVGDSPLFLYRDGKLQQLNEDHSMGPQIDFMVQNGLMDAEVGRTHPDRSCLTSVIMGAKIEHTDCPTEPFRLLPGDLVLLCSDGIQYLTDAQIEAVLANCENEPAEVISAALGDAIDDLDDPEQDNISFTAIRIMNTEDSDEFFEIAWDLEEEQVAANSDGETEDAAAANGAT